MTTALCKALCLLLYQKLDIPSYAKPMKLSNYTSLTTLAFEKSGNFNDILFIRMSRAVQL